MKTGGAKGADDVWLRAAREHGFHCRVLTFSGHALTSTVAREWSRELSTTELKDVRGLLETVAKRLGKRLPLVGTYTYSLLARNAHVVFSVQAVYAVGRRSATRGLGIAGGTGWTCELYAMQDDIHLYFYDLDEGKWMQWDSKWVEIPEPPYPSTYTAWAGIGVRVLTKKGEIAIRRVFES